MFDYELIEALAMIAIEGGFDKAAKVLHITQSDVSQRLKQLEQARGGNGLHQHPGATHAGVKN